MQLGATEDVASVCQSPNIAKWSFYKPVNHESIKALTLQQIRSVNDGFTLFTFNNPSRMIYELQNPNASTIWSYADRTGPFRLTDFENYNSQILDFGLSFLNTSSVRVGDSLKFSYNFDIPSLLQWAYFEGVRSYVDIVALVYESGTQFDAGGTKGCWVCKIVSMVDFDENLSITIPSGLSDGIYEVRLAFSTATTGWNNGEWQYYNSSVSWFGFWYALPEQCKATFNVSGTPGPTPGGDLFEAVEFDNWPYMRFEFFDPLIYDLMFRNMVVLNDTRKDLDVYISYAYTNVLNGEVFLASYTFPLNEGDLYKINEVTYAGPIEAASTAKLDDGIINIKMFASITDKSTHVSQTKTWTVNVEKTE